MMRILSYASLLVVLIASPGCAGDELGERARPAPPAGTTSDEAPAPGNDAPTPSDEAAAPSSRSPSPTAHPIVDASKEQLFGATTREAWLPPDTAAAFATAGTTYRLYTLDRRLGEAPGEVAGTPGETCSNPTVAIEAPPNDGADVVGIAGPWDALPRVPRLQDPDQPAYQQAVSAWLRAQGISEPDVRITQLLRVDLEGDGTEEVLLSANRTSDLSTSARAGDYGLVLLRRVVDGEVRTVPIVGDYYPEACVAVCAPMEYRIIAVLDVDGDGRQEPVVGYRYYEGEGATIFSLEEQQARERLYWSCGV